jgi:RNA polymerase sigma-70 factor (ECF subfamily)
MGSVCGVLPFPASGVRIRAKTTVEHRLSEEAALVRRVQTGDEAAFRQIVERYQAKVFSIICGILRNHNDAEDIAQQVFTKAFFSIRHFDFRSSLLTWIYKITVNECYDYLRKKKVRKLVYESDFSEEEARRLAQSAPVRDQRPAPDVAAAQRDLVVKLLARLPAEERSLLLLKEVEGHSVEELAEMTGINENTIKVKLFRARHKLLKLAQRLTRKPGLAPA